MPVYLDSADILVQNHCLKLRLSLLKIRQQDVRFSLLGILIIWCVSNRENEQDQRAQPC
jgi:hypothetical protein